MSTYRGDILALLIVGLVLLAFIGRALLPGRVLVPTDIITSAWSPWQQPNTPIDVHNFMLSDAVSYMYPVKTFMAEVVRAGELPLWNPYIFTGYPFTYNTQAGLFYPLSILYYVLPGPTAVDATIFLQYLLGAWFMFAYLRKIGLKRPAAVAGTIVFLFNGIMIVWLEWQVVHAAVIWLPAQLYLVERIYEKLDAQRQGAQVASPWLEGIGIAFLFAVPWLGGHWNWTLYTSMTLALYMLFRFQGGGLFPNGRGLRLLLGSLGAGTAMTLMQVWPAFNYLSQSHRGEIPFGDLLRYGFLSQAAVWFIPNFFGNPIANNYWGSDISNSVESTAYVGILAAMLAALAIWLRRDWHTKFYTAWGGLTLLWALGTPAYGLLYVLPVFNGLFPSRAVIVVAICAAVLSALALDKLIDANFRPRRSHWLAAAVVFLTILMVVAGFTLFHQEKVGETWAFLRPEFALFALFLGGSLLLLSGRLSGRLSPQLFAVLAIVWLAADLFAFGHDYNTIGYTADLYPPTDTVTYLQQDLEHEVSRIVTLSEGIAFVPNTSLVGRIPNISGYEPSLLRRLVNLFTITEGDKFIFSDRVLEPLSTLDTPIADMLNIKHIVTIDEYYADAAVPERERPRATAWQTLPARQPFSMREAGLQRVDLPIQSDAAAQGTVTARIFSADGTYEFANNSVELTADRDESWHTFFFTPFASEWGRDFLLEVSFEGEGAVQVGSTAQGEIALHPFYLERPLLQHEARKTRIYLNEGYFPRAYAVPQAQIVSSEEEVLAAIEAQQAQLDQLVVLEMEGQPAPPDLGRPLAEGELSVEMIEYDLNQVRLSAEMAQAGFVVLSDTFYPGWEATLDGAATPIYRANSILRAVYVPAGQHEVKFQFRPRDFYYGAMISGTVAVLCLFAFFILWRRSPKSSADIRPAS